MDTMDYGESVKLLMAGEKPQVLSLASAVRHVLGLPTLRISWLTVVQKTSAEIDEMIRNLESDTEGREVLARLMREFSWAGGYLEKLAHVIQAAELRLFAHGAPKAIQDWIHDDPLPPEPPQNWRAPSLKIVPGGA